MTSGHFWVATRIVALVSLTLIAGCGRFADDETRIERAREHIAQGEYRAATIELKNVLKGSPRNTEARLLLGQTAFELGDPASAEKELRRAAEFGAAPGRYMETLGRAMLEQGLYSELLEALDPDTADDPGLKGLVTALRGQAQLALNQLPAATLSFREALALAPGSADAFLGLAGVARANGDMAGAEREIQRVLAADPASVAGNVALARLHYERKRFEPASAAFADALRLAREQRKPPKDLFAIGTGLAEAQIAAGDYDAAEGSVQDLLALAPNNPVAQFLTARVAFDRRDYDAAASHLQEVLAATPEYAAALTLMGATEYARGNLVQAEMHLQNAVGRAPENLAARKLLGKVRLEQNRPDAALTALEPASGLTEDPDGMSMLAKASLRTGASDAGLSYFEQGIEVDPEDPDMQLGLAAAYMAAGQYDKAVAQLEALPEMAAGGRDRSMLLVLAHLKNDDEAAARAQVEAMLAEDPDGRAANNVAAGLYLALENDEQAKVHLEKTLAAAPDDLPALVNLGRIHLRANDPEGAFARYEAFLADNPGNLGAMMSYSQILEANGRNDESLAQMEAAMAANPEAPQPRLLLARYFLASGDAERARLLADEAVQLGPNLASAHVSQGMVRLAGGRAQEALESFRRAVTLAPRSTTAQFNLARAQVAMRMESEARDSLDRVLQLKSDHAAARIALARLETRAGNHDRAGQLAGGLAADYPNASQPKVLLGDVALAAGNAGDAVTHYEAAYATDPGLQLAGKIYQARSAAGLDDATGVLESWVASNQDDVAARMLLAQAHQRSGDNDAAAGQYEQVIERAPDNPIALNNLAWIYAERGDDRSIARAIELAEQANSAQPDSGAITDTLGWLLHQHGDRDRGLSLLRRASTQSPNNPDIQYHLAAALAAAGSSSEARTILQDLLARHDAFATRDQATELLRSL